MDTKLRLAFLGLGNMGAPLAQLLVQDGFSLTVWNRSREKLAAVVAAGAKAAATPAEAARDADLVLTLLADDQAVEAVTLGPDGLIEGLRTGAVHVGMSTVSPGLSSRLAQAHASHGSTYFACPVFGRPDAAAARKLWLVPAGPEEVFARIRPVLERISRGMSYMGSDPAAGNVAKLAGNFLIASAIEAMAEAFTLVEKQGLKPAGFLEMIDQAVLQSPLYRRYGTLLAEGQFVPPGFELRWGLKDVRLVRQQADVASAPMPLADLLHEHLLSSAAQGRSQWDWVAMGEVLRERAGLPGRHPE
jgi:3-hydroxyisobutyrate dehydrogenase-like beta-hydroxyacid dehydrogenase